VGLSLRELRTLILRKRPVSPIDERFSCILQRKPIPRKSIATGGVEGSWYHLAFVIDKASRHRKVYFNQRNDRIGVPAGLQYLATVQAALDIAKIADERARRRAVHDMAPADGLESHEEAAIRRILEKAGGNRRKAAAMLRIGEATLYRKLKKYNLG